jgi:hypothetical protein
MKKLKLNIYPLDVNKFKAIEEAFNELLTLLAEQGIIELEE